MFIKMFRRLFLMSAGDKSYEVFYYGIRSLMSRWGLGVTALLVTFSTFSANGQTYKILYSCDSPNAVIHCPTGLTLSDSTLYGSANDAVFKIETDGSNFSVLHTFDYGDGGGGIQSSVIIDGSTLYGTAAIGGINSGGTAFKMAIDGSNFSVMHSFGSANDGDTCSYKELISGSTIYGVTYSSGPVGDSNGGGGTIYKINTDNTGYSILHHFATGPDDWGSEYGLSGLVLSGSTLFGSSSSPNRIYKINTDGTGFDTVANFNGDGPGKLVLGDSKIYGITDNRLFVVNTDGTGFKTLHTFSGNDGSPFRISSALILEGSKLYGTTCDGGNNGYGTIYQIDIDGKNYKVLHSFDANDGGFPKMDLVLDGSTLYGTIYGDNFTTFGTVFSLTIPEPSIWVLLGFGAIGLASFSHWRR